MITWKAAALSDQGVKRQDNQDNFFLSDDQRLFVVADGMGGALGGATAARLTVEAIGGYWTEEPPKTDSPESIKQWIGDAIEKANETVFKHSAENPAVQGMGTTVVVAIQADNQSAYIAHVGDSRAYRIRDGKAELLTQDHSLVMELFRSGHITEAQMKESPFKSYITRCIGHKNKVEVDHKPAKIEPGDWILLCTDGLTAVLQDENIGDTIAVAEDPEAACQKLVELTLAGGAPDNVTVIAVRYDSAGADGPAPTNNKDSEAE